MAATLVSAHHSSSSTTCCSVVGKATRSGGCSMSPASALTTSRKALPREWLARSYGSVDVRAVRVDGASMRGGLRSRLAGSGGSAIVPSRFSNPGRLAMAPAMASRSLPVTAWSSHPQPHHERRRSPMPAERSPPTAEGPDEEVGLTEHLIYQMLWLMGLGC